MKRILLSLILLSAAALLPARGENIVALTSGNRLLTFDSIAPQTVTNTVTVSGLTAGDLLVGIDFRPATGELFALGNSSRLYSVNAATGVATPIGAGGAFTLNGTRFGFDFNPTVDRIRLTSDADQDLRLHPITGALVSTDTPLAYSGTDVNTGANPNVVGSAYTNNFSTALATTLYDIDSALDVLVIQNPPNAGLLNTVGSLGVDTTDNVGFDISGITGIAYAALTVGGTTNLYSINLLSGAATPAAASPAIAPTNLGIETVVDIAVPAKAGSRLLNISTRGQVGTGENVLIAGFITREGVSSRVVLRGVGPSLSSSAVTQALQDPTIILFDKNGVQLASNDDFGSSPQQAAELTALGLAPTDSREAAIVTTLVPDRYTAQIVGKNGATGVALVEVYLFQ